MKDATNNKDRLEYLRTQIREENISMGELIELQGLANEIDPGDVELLEWAGVPEFPEESGSVHKISVTLFVEGDTPEDAREEVRSRIGLLDEGTRSPIQGFEILEPEENPEEDPENPQLWIARVKRSGGGTFHGTGKKILTSEPMSWEDANNWVLAWMDSPLGDVISGGFQEAPKDARSIYPRDN